MLTLTPPCHPPTTTAKFDGVLAYEYTTAMLLIQRPRVYVKQSVRPCRARRSRAGPWHTTSWPLGIDVLRCGVACRRGSVPTCRRFADIPAGAFIRDRMPLMVQRDARTGAGASVILRTSVAILWCAALPRQRPFFDGTRLVQQTPHRTMQYVCGREMSVLSQCSLHQFDCGLIETVRPGVLMRLPG
jgi:hypothetical protein